MNKQIPTLNKIIKFGQLKRNYILHQSKVKNAKSTLTTRIITQNKTNYNLTNRLHRKPFGNSFNRMIDIDFQNKALLKKLTQKSKFNATLNRTNPTATWSSQNNNKINRNSNRKRHFQQYELLKENQGLLKRLKQTKPMYLMQKYASERKITQQYINSISKFGYKGLKPNKTLFKFEMVNNLAKQYQKSKQLRQKSEQDKNSQTSFTQVFPNKYQSKQKELKLPSSIQKYKIQPSPEVLNNKLNKIPKNLAVSQQGQRIPPGKQNSFTMRIDNNNSSFLRISSQEQNQNRRHSNMPQLSSNIVTIIPEKSITINGKKFLLKGKQHQNKISLQILNCKNKQIGHEFIHQVEIDSSLYLKRFQGRIDVLIQHLRFNKENQGFYIE